MHAQNRHAPKKTNTIYYQRTCRSRKSTTAIDTIVAHIQTLPRALNTVTRGPRLQGPQVHGTHHRGGGHCRSQGKMPPSAMSPRFLQSDSVCSHNFTVHSVPPPAESPLNMLACRSSCIACANKPPGAGPKHAPLRRLRSRLAVTRSIPGVRFRAGRRGDGKGGLCGEGEACGGCRLAVVFARGRVVGVVCGVKRGDGDGNVASRVEATDVAVVDSPGEAEGGGEEGGGEERGLKARLYLLLVPFMWGTYGPALRFIYSQPHAPSASIITLSRKVASVAFFLLLQPLEKAVKKSSSEDHHNGAAVFVSESKAGNSWGAAAELGLWTFLGTALQTNALGSTTATRAGFILQTITVLVPLISAVSGSHVSKVTWGSAFLALTGVVLMSVVGNEGAAGGSVSSLLCSEGSAGCQSALVGDLEVLAAAFFYAINTIRLGVHAKKMSALELSTRVMVVSTACTFCWAGYDYATASLDGRDGGLAWQGLTSPEVMGATIFAALVPGTLAHLAQAVGQKTIPPSEAQVYYSLQPVWAALFSALLLHESMSPLAWGAGCLIVFAALLAGTQNS